MSGFGMPNPYRTIWGKIQNRRQNEVLDSRSSRE
jgi:hypothetical protein